MPAAEKLDAWIDVGGTFTDCYLRLPGGDLRRGKTLSSGRVPVTCQWHPPEPRCWASELAEDPDDFWVGAYLLALDAESNEVQRVEVTGFSEGWLQVEHSAFASARNADDRFELDPGVEAPVLGIRRLLGIPLLQPLPALRVRLGTTRGTNALLTRRGAATALAVTAPFEDLLHIGDQTRPHLFELAARRSPPLADYTVGVPERLTADGRVLTTLDAEQIASQLRQALKAGCRSLAICLVHSYLNPEHEQQLKSLAIELGFDHVSCSSELAPLIEIVARAQTTVVDAYLSPIVRRYLSDLRSQFESPPPPSGPRGAGQPACAPAALTEVECQAGLQMHVMTSAGGLMDWREYSGKDCILSGPAGGVAALNAIAEAAELGDVIGLDMGGTSTDVCRVTGQGDLQFESTKAGVRILVPTLPIETVAAGGGSICWFDGVSLRVGPQSAGAVPGPACYGRSGPLTVTDLNVFLGRIPEQQFPFTIDRVAIERRLDELLEQAQGALGPMSREALAQGLRRIANEHMAEAVRTVTIAQGADPRSHVLVGFGGAAGQHICEIADSLGISRIVDSAEGGLLSALGMGLADLRLDEAIAVYRPLRQVDWPRLEKSQDEKFGELKAKFVQQGARPSEITTQCRLELRYLGTDSTLTIPYSAVSEIVDDFHVAHERRFGYRRDGHEIELVAVRLEGTAFGAHRLAPITRHWTRKPLDPKGAWPRVPRCEFHAGDYLGGPAIVLNEGSTLVVEAGWSAECLSDGTLLLERGSSSDAERAQRGEHAAAPESHNVEDFDPGEFDPVFRDCFAARLSAIATQMGWVLQQTAVSVNVKQRRDFSCAVFDARGRLLANAPHVPVHLGAMGQTVRSILAKFPEVRPGDCFITNDPYRGGSHLPDVTVVTPVFDPAQREPVMFVANRAHHADVGGIAPGSMSVRAAKLGDEGVVIPPRRLADGGQDCTPQLREWFESAPYPPRNIDENLADIAAQQAANARGVELLQQYSVSESWYRLTAYAEHVLAASEKRMRQFIASHLQGERQFADHLDDGTVICVAIRLHSGGQLHVDFSGSGPASKGNFNANPSIVTAAIMYVLRCLIDDDLPLNEGVLRCVDLNIPPGVLNPQPHERPEESPAMAAGNVETSQRVVDVLLGALGQAAASQGTMNNLLFGNSQFGFYETICGGAGATRDSDGESGIQTHMTNTRLTDPEVLESRYPVRLVRFGLRVGSGGAGRQRGGDGVVREIEFLEPVTVSLLTSRRDQYAPFGLEGGRAGQTGQNALITSEGRRLLPGCCEFDAQIGDRLEIQTPGGGGFGSPDG